MRDEYTELITERKVLERQAGELAAKQKEVEQKIRAIKEQVVSAQGERCAYCGTWLQTQETWGIEHYGPPPEWERWTEDEQPDYAYPEGYVPHNERSPYHIHLKLPRSQGGDDVIDNLVATCAKCGTKKGTQSHEDFKRKVAQQQMLEEYTRQKLEALAAKS